MEQTKNLLDESENLQFTRKETTLWSRYCWYFAASIAIVAVVFSGTELHALDRFGETFTSKLCEILPSPPQKEVIGKQEEEQEQEDEEEFNDAVVSFGEERIHNATYSKLSHVYFAGGRTYRAMEAMESRYNLMKEVCNRYADKMRGESILHESRPKAHSNFLFYPVKRFAFCQSPGVATKSVKIFFYAGEMGKPGQSSQETFTMQFPSIMNRVNVAVVVRHPLERLVSIYRNTFEAHVDANIHQKMEQKYTFPEFVDIVLYGYAELSRFFEQNNLDMSTPIDQMETGMVDGEKEPSIKWNSYWKHCGVCHRDFQPKYIIHLENFKEDLRAVYEDWMEPKYWEDFEKREMERFLNLKNWPVISGKPEILQHYYSQLTKSKIQALYEKYRADHEIFGYTPEYFIALGKED